MSKTIKNSKNLYFAIGFTIALFFYMTFIFVPNSSCFRLDVGPNSLGLSFSYTKDMVQSFFGSRTQDQLLCYSQFLKVWDPIFALISTAMFGSWIVYIFKNKRLFLIAPTILTMIADWSENYIELLMIKTYVNSSFISETMVSLGSGINSFKLSMSGLTWLIIVIGIILAIKAFFTKPKLR
jgi:hypothetical protein